MLAEGGDAEFYVFDAELDFEPLLFEAFALVACLLIESKIPLWGS